MYSTITSGAFVGVEAYLVHVEVDCSMGLPCFSMVGSLGSEVREAKERVWVALKNAGLSLSPMHITVNLSPADSRKEGTAFDLPIAVGVLQSYEMFPETATKDILFLGELGLNGEIKPVRGVLPIVREAARCGIKECIVPCENAEEGAVIPGITVRGVQTIEELLVFLQIPREDIEMREEILKTTLLENECFENTLSDCPYDFAEVSGQQVVKRAAEIAAAGFHNLLMIGPPGAGKSMIAKRIPGILPPLNLEESLEVTSVMSVAGMLKDTPLVLQRPFQAPHHTISQPAMIGGGKIPRPGMISLAHRGVLFLDELPEFGRMVLDSLRQPLEEREVHVVRNGGNVKFPADFMLVCAMNPCPCGYYPDTNRCHCTTPMVERYVGKVSGPILDRIDLCVEVQAVDIKSLREGHGEESSSEIRQRVLKARQMQEKRFAGSSIRFNANMESGDVERFCKLGKKEAKCAEKLYHSLQLSARGYHRMLKVARTIADLAGAEEITVDHLMEAACYRKVGVEG